MQMGHARRYALAMMNLCPVEGLGSVSRKGKKQKDSKERRYTKGVIATLTLTAKRRVPRWTFVPVFPSLMNGWR